jgi:hypothetical protein
MKDFRGGKYQFTHGERGAEKKKASILRSEILSDIFTEMRENRV